MSNVKDTLGHLDRLLRRKEKLAILHAIHASGGNRQEAARMLGMSRSRLYRRFEALGIGPSSITRARTTDGDLPIRKLDDVLQEVELHELLRVRRQTSGHRTRAARILGITRSRFYRQLHALDGSRPCKTRCFVTNHIRNGSSRACFAAENAVSGV